MLFTPLLNTQDVVDKETETVQTIDCESWDDESDSESSVATLESIGLLELHDEDEDPYHWYNDDEEDCPVLYKNTCIERAMSGFTGILKSLVSTSSATARPVDVVLTDSVLIDDFYR